MTVSKNNGTDGDGIYIADGKLYVGEKVRIINNRYDNLYLAEGCLVSGESAGDTDSVELQAAPVCSPAGSRLWCRSGTGYIFRIVSR